MPFHIHSNYYILLVRMSETAADKGVRPPIVAIVGHIDHGKSTLLDYIRKTNVVEAEAGGITQHLSAYEAVHKNTTGEHRITFLDTPGHEAFKAMRSRGLEVADVAILAVSAEDGVKTQTVETLKLIAEAKIPYIVALTKIDKPDANVEKAKMSLLDLILLAAELEGVSADPAAPPNGVVIDAYADSKRGTTATLLVKNGTLKSGQFVVAGGTWSPVRIMENFLGKSINQALPGMPVCVVGFSALPAAGTQFTVAHSKKEAEAEALANTQPHVRAHMPAAVPAPAALDAAEAQSEEPAPHLVLPIVIKTDVAGMGDAIMHELRKLPQSDQLEIHVALQGVGPISENDVKLVGGGKTPGIIIGFNVKADAAVRDRKSTRLNSSH